MPEVAEWDSKLNAIIGRIHEGDSAAREILYAEVYRELLECARSLERSDCQTMSGTAILHESFIKLSAPGRLEAVRDARHFRNLFAKVMQQVLASYARTKRTQKRGGSWAVMELDSVLGSMGVLPEQFDFVSEAIDVLESEVPILAEVIRLQYFHRMTYQEIGHVVGESESAVGDLLAAGKARLRLLLADWSE